MATPDTTTTNTARTIIRLIRSGRLRAARRRLHAADANNTLDTVAELVADATDPGIVLDARTELDTHAASDLAPIPAWLRLLVADEIRAVCARMHSADLRPERVIARVIAADLVAETVAMRIWHCEGRDAYARTRPVLRAHHPTNPIFPARLVDAGGRTTRR